MSNNVDISNLVKKHAIEEGVYLDPYYAITIMFKTLSRRMLLR